MSSVVYMSLLEVLEILDNPVEDKISTVPAVNPKNGQVYLFSYDGQMLLKTGEQTSTIGSTIGLRNPFFIKKEPKIKKAYHPRLIDKKPIKFYRHGYESKDTTMKMVVVQYVGVDYNIEKEDSHGNMIKYTQRTPVRTLPSVMKKMSTHIDRTPSEIYKKEVVGTQTSKMHIKVQLPKNVEQISNKLKYERKNQP